MCSESIEMGEPVAEVPSATSVGLIAEGSYAAFGSEGTVKVSYGARSYAVHAGESFYFKAGKKHAIETSGTRDAILIWVSTPPSF